MWSVALGFFFPVHGWKQDGFEKFDMTNSFPYISYYFHIPKIFDYFFYSVEKIGIYEKVICYHNISN